VSLTQARIRWVIVGLVIIFLVVAGRLLHFGSVTVDSTIEGQARDVIQASRPPILDRNGIPLAVDIRVPSLFAEPKRIINVDEAVEKLSQVLPDLNRDWLRNRLSGDKGFVWVKRELTPAIQDRIMALGIPGLDFLTESKRFYPGGSDASHILGAVNVDNQGIAGIERHMDTEDIALLQSIGLARGQALTPVNLSIDLRVQHILRGQLVDALTRYKAIAAGGVMIDIKTGEVIAMSSVPDFDPNDPASALVDGRMNRITAGKFELGSAMKTVTLAGALDSGKVRITDQFDARFGVRFGRFTIGDFHGKHRILSVPEIYKYSSNIGTVRVMQAMGKDEFRAFLTRIGFDSPLPLETPEKTASAIPKQFSEIVAATASFGHGMSITPMHLAMAMGAFVNDGNYVPATLYRRSEEEAKAISRSVISPHTSSLVRYLMRLNAKEGSGSQMNKIADGYRTGGKTGTAEKVVKGKYDSSKTFAVFASAFPMDNPRYAMVVVVDEPQDENAQSGHTAGWNAGQITGRVVQQVAPLLGIKPDFDALIDTALVPVELR
jgi:cell division protein FtsI (penicillin-binding protein 3)